MNFEYNIETAQALSGSPKWAYIKGIEDGAELILNELLDQKEINISYAKTLYQEIKTLRKSNGL